MQLVVKLKTGSSFLHAIEENATVLTLKESLLDKTDKSDPAELLISHNGDDLTDDSVQLSNIEGMENLSTVVVGFITPVPTVEVEKQQESSEQSVDAEEIKLTIIITNIPRAEKNKTEDAIVEVFSGFGEINRLILQDDGGSAQHAVLIFATPEAAQMAAKSNKVLILDAEVSVIEACSLHSGSGSAPPTADQNAAKVGELLAGGYTYGQKGFASVQKFDENHRITMKMKAGAEVAKMKALEINQQYQISSKVSSGYESASKKATELNSKYQISEKATFAADKVSQSAKELNEKYKLSEKASAAKDSASQTAKQMSNKAMENETIAAGVKKAGSLFSSFVNFSSQSINDAKTRLSESSIDSSGSTPITAEKKST